jgi:hypothetical protein
MTIKIRLGHIMLANLPGASEKQSSNGLKIWNSRVFKKE